jgi:hypothetical protein
LLDGERPGRGTTPGTGTELVDETHDSMTGRTNEGPGRDLRCRQAPGSKPPDEPLLPGFGAPGR